MSVVFRLRGKPLSVEKWNRLLSEWEDGENSEPYDEPGLKRSGGEYATHVWGPGSIRGVLVFVDARSKEAEVHLKALASRRDWAIAFAILRAASRASGARVVREDDRVYSEAELTDERAGADAVEEFCTSANAIAREARGPVWVPTSAFELPLDPKRFESCTPEKVPEIEAELSALVERYATASRAPIFRRADGRKLTAWDFEPALLPKVDEVSCPAEGPSEESRSGGERVCVPFDHLLRVLGDRAKDLNLAFFVPQLDAERDRALAEALLAPGVPLEEEPVECPGAAGEPSEPLDEDQLDFLAVLFRGIAGYALRGVPVEKIRRDLLDRGVPRDLADACFDLIQLAACGLVAEGKSADTVIRELMESGCPGDMARMAVGALLEAARGSEE